MELNMKELEKTLMREWATKAIQSLSEENKQELIITAIFNQLDKMDFSWNIREVFTDYAKNYANEYIQREDFQQKIKQRVYEVVDETFDKLLEKMSEEFGRNLKWSAERIFK